MVALESTDGRYLYYSAHPEQKKGIWRVSSGGGPETLESKAVDSWNSWALTGRGLYFLSKAAEPSPLISFYEFSTREVQSLARVGAGQEFDPNPGVNVSPDERWLVYCGAFSGYEIFTVDNFR